MAIWPRRYNEIWPNIIYENISSGPKRLWNHIGSGNFIEHLGIIKTYGFKILAWIVNKRFWKHRFNLMVAKFNKKLLFMKSQQFVNSEFLSSYHALFLWVIWLSNVCSGVCNWVFDDSLCFHKGWIPSLKFGL